MGEQYHGQWLNATLVSFCPRRYRRWAMPTLPTTGYMVGNAHPTYHGVRGGQCPPYVGWALPTKRGFLMPNYRRLFVPGGTIFLTVATYRRAPLFRDEANVARLRQAVR